MKQKELNCFQKQALDILIDGGLTSISNTLAYIFYDIYHMGNWIGAEYTEADFMYDAQAYINSKVATE